MKGFLSILAKGIFLLFLIGVPVSRAHAAGEFKMSINTDPFNVGDASMRIPINPNYVPNYTVDWGDGNVDSGITGDAEHGYALPGTYQISISGNPHGLYFNNTNGPVDKVVSIDQWGTIPWSSMEQAFAGIPSLTIFATDAPDLSAVTNMTSMFANIDFFSDAGGNMNSWDTSNVTQMVAVFINGGFDEDISGWNTSNVTSMSSMFNGAASFNRNISSWNTSNVTTMASMFSGAANFNQPIGNWNTSNVTDMYGMFASASSFDQPLAFDTSRVTNMSRMFEAASSYNSTISFDASAATDMSYMFHEATSFNQNLLFYTNNVTDMSYMFADTSFNQNGPASWDTSSVTSMSDMFARNTAFNQDISNWNVSAVTDMSSVFEGATAFNQPIGIWDTSSTTNMTATFSGASGFDQDLGSWDFGSVTALDDFLKDANISYPNYDSLLQAWDTQSTQNGLSTYVSDGVYCNGNAYRSHLILTKGWSIIDTGTLAGCPAPTVTSVTSTDPNGDYKTGDTVHISVVFSEPVNVGSGAPPTLQLETGTTDAVATFVSGSGSNTLIFAFTVLASHQSSDLQYMSTLALSGSALEDVASSSLHANTVLPALNSASSLAGTKNIVINPSVPVVSSSSSVASGGVWLGVTARSGMTEYKAPVRQNACANSAFSVPLRLGQKNTHVVRVKQFLNKFVGAKLNSSQVFDDATRRAVIRFQEAYKRDILAPSGLKKGTGLWYAATMKKANELGCGI